jgi:hypothetical protein
MAGEAGDEEATWRDLVAQYSTPAAADGTVPWPVREELSSARQAPPGAPGPAGAPGSTDTPMDTTDARGESAAPGTPGTGDPGTSDTGTGDPASGREAATGDPASGRAADANGQAAPPVPPPLPRLDPVSKGAWAALFGGPGYLLLAVLLGWVVPSWAAFCAVGAFVGGFATLVVRMGDRPPGDSGPNDGAVV